MAKAQIGLQQGRRLAQMKYDERLDFIAEGLPIVLESASGFLAASKSLSAYDREAEVLRNFAEEEAGKALILLDMARCPPKQIASKIGTMMKWFYDHLARLIYAKASSWYATDVGQLQRYVNHERPAHHIDGDYGEYILPNHALYLRESQLYADLAAYEDEKPFWNEPRSTIGSLLHFDPPAHQALSALKVVGAFTQKGIRVIADVWGQEEFDLLKTSADAERLTEAMLRRIIDLGLPSDSASDKDMSRIYRWQMPMYNLDLSPIDVPMDELQRQRDARVPDEC
jgi:hypothetical protein